MTAAFGRRWYLTLPALGLGVISFWAGLFLGSAYGYDAWQRSPDPPPEAFSDASAAGALILGWVPGLVVCLGVFGLARGILLLVARSRTQPVLAGEVVDAVEASETGNPFQSPQVPGNREPLT